MCDWWIVGWQKDRKDSFHLDRGRLKETQLSASVLESVFVFLALGFHLIFYNFMQQLLIGKAQKGPLQRAS